MKRMYRIVSMLLTLGMLAAIFTGCAAQPKSTYDTSDKIADLAIEEFLAFSKIPRASWHTQKALKYLQKFAADNGYAYSTDDYGNFWMDISATKGYEAYPKVILQSHMDMVLVGEAGDDVDFETTAVTTVVEGNTITSDGTSLGADNGIGVGIVLAIARSNTEHGPIRILITTDEEVGPQGASKLPAQVIDADYLINVDAEDENTICYSNAGNLEVFIKKLHDTSPMNSQQRAYQLSVSGLLGGHSGTDINKNRLSANTALMEMLDAVQKTGVGVYLSEMQAGTAVNVIAGNGSVTFAVSIDDETIMQQAILKVEQDLKKRFPLEKMECVMKEVAGSELSIISAQSSSDFIALARSLPQGVIAMSQKVEGLVQTSSNVGVLKLEEGAAEITNFSRSCINNDLDQFEADFQALTQKYGYEYHLTDKTPGYDGDPNSPLLKLMEKAYESMSYQAKLVATHGGLELSWFDSFRNGIQMVSIGPNIENAHSLDEILYIDTVESTVNAVLYCLKNIDNL